EGMGNVLKVGNDAVEKAPPDAADQQSGFGGGLGTLEFDAFDESLGDRSRLVAAEETGSIDVSVGGVAFWFVECALHCGGQRFNIIDFLAHIPPRPLETFRIEVR